MRLALSEPVVHKGRNPATGEALQIEQWDPGSESEPADFQDAQGRTAKPPVAPPLTGDGNAWEEQASPLVRTFPHCSLMDVQFHLLTQHLVGQPTHAPCYFGSADYEEWVDVLPVPAAEALADASSERIESIITSLAADASEESVKYTGDALRQLQQLAVLAKQTGGFVCLHGRM